MGLVVIGKFVGKCWPLSHLEYQAVSRMPDEDRGQQRIPWARWASSDVWLAWWATSDDGKLLGLRSDVCPLVVLSVVIGQMC